MTQIEKIAQLKSMLGADAPSDEELITLLLITKGAILNRRYPLGEWLEEEVPTKYEHIQLMACVHLFNKKGAEGQTSHSENGVSRSYESADVPESLMGQVVPFCEVL